MAKKVALILERDRCKGCGLCIAFCSRRLLRAGEDLNALGYYPVEMTDMERCTGCGNCSVICPDLAIFVQKEVTA
ncbi:MAG: 4Fe-4S binding protein [Peptococcaceae bacterium]|nr:4Fe-4S binding protein [Peptococcaceae bacterium]